MIFFLQLFFAAIAIKGGNGKYLHSAWNILFFLRASNARKKYIRNSVKLWNCQRRNFGPALRIRYWKDRTGFWGLLEKSRIFLEDRSWHDHGQVSTILCSTFSIHVTEIRIAKSFPAAEGIISRFNECTQRDESSLSLCFWNWIVKNRVSSILWPFWNAANAIVSG